MKPTEKVWKRLNLFSNAMRKLVNIKLQDLSFFLLIVFFVDSVIHIGRHLTASGTDYLRLPLLIVLFCSCLPALIKDKKFFSSYYTHLIGIVLLVLMVSYVKAVLLNQNIELANDFLSPFIYLSLFPILIYSVKKEMQLMRLVFIITIIGCLISLGMILLILSFVINYDLYCSLSDFMELFELGYALGGAAGVIRFLPKGVAVQIMAYFFGVFYCLKKKEKKYILLVLINGLALFLTFTRGIWLGLFCGTIFLLIRYKFANFPKNNKIKRMIRFGIYSGFIIVLLLAILYPDIFDFAFGRIFGEHYTSKSDELRKTMTKMLYELISEHIAWGGGAGAHIELRDGRVEMTYHDVASKIGVIGLIILMLPFLNILFEKFIIKKDDDFRLLQLCALSSFISILVSTYTNPYFITSFGLFLYCFCMRIYSYRRYPFEKCKIDNKKGNVSFYKLLKLAK